MNYQLIAFNCRYTHSCLALYYLRNALQKKLPTSQITIQQKTINDPYYPTLLSLTRSQANVLFFSVYIWNGALIKRLIHDLPRARPDLPIVLGGPQVDEIGPLPPHCTKVTGDVEGLDDHFFQDLANEQLQPEYYAANPVETFPFPYQEDDFVTTLNNRYLYYETTRGCPFHCSYCLSASRPPGARKSVEEIKQELSCLLAQHPLLIKFVDRTFNDQPQRALAIWQFLAAQETQTTCHFEIAPDRFTPALLDFLATVPAGRFQFEVGLQSWHPATLKAIDRGMDPVQTEKNIRCLVNLKNIHIHLDLILGLPLDTPTDFKVSINKTLRLQPDHLQMGLLKVLPHTKLDQDVQQYGITHCQTPPYEVLSTHSMDHLELQALYLLGECIEKFYNNAYFQTFWSYLIKQEAAPTQFFEPLLSDCLAHDFFNLAPTPQRLLHFLHRQLPTRPDYALCLELLTYDWLSCGHRFLPEPLNQLDLMATRHQLRQQLPQVMPGLFDHRQRNPFLKQSIFLPLSPPAAQLLGYAPQPETPFYLFCTPKAAKGKPQQPVQWQALPLPHFEV